MPVRQQRGNSARGQLPFRKVATASPIAWTLTGETTTTVDVTLPVSTIPYVITGVLPLMRASDNAAPVSQAVTANVITLSYPSAGPTGDTYELAANQPQVRGPQGAYLAPGSVEFVGPFIPTIETTGPGNTLAANVALVIGNSGHVTLPFPTSGLVITVCWSALDDGDLFVDYGVHSWTQTSGQVATYQAAAGDWSQVQIN